VYEPAGPNGNVSHTFLVSRPIVGPCALTAIRLCVVIAGLTSQRKDDPQPVGDVSTYWYSV